MVNSTTIQVNEIENVVELDFPETTIQTTQTNQVVVEVYTGKPGAQNLFVGTAAPSNPQEGWVWIDTT